MKILITGGSGDLGVLLARELEGIGDIPVRLDIRQPINPQRGELIIGSILDRACLAEAMRSCDLVVHIAAWHGYHLVAGLKDVDDFWDLNVTGTFNVFEEAARQDIKKVVYISSTSAEERFGIYGHTKVLGEEIARTYHQRHNMDVIVLRPGAFIPYWNKNVYASFVEWAHWYWKGAVHISDVLQTVVKSIQKLKAGPIPNIPTLYVDGKYEYTNADLLNWEKNTPGSIFKKYYQDYADVAEKYGLGPTVKPTVFDIGPTKEFLAYEPTYSFMNLLQELAEFGPGGPPEPNF
jgi:nucleoside-diphosphate-sugar epimerase